MRKTLVIGVLIMSAISGLFAGGSADFPPLPGHEHRVNFGLFNVGYERIQSDSLYTGIEAKLASFILSEKDKIKSMDHYVNGEIRLGYNHTLGLSDTVLGYGGVGFSAFSIEKQDGKLRNWNYGTLGVKYLHQFGSIFEMGLHVKGFKSISQKRYAYSKTKKANDSSSKIIEMKADSLSLNEEKSTSENTEEFITATESENLAPQFVTFNFINEKDHGKTNLTAVKVNDSRFMMQIGVPMIWHVGSQKNWEIQIEPYYMQIPNEDLTHIIGSNVTVGYRY
jgi:hypothetical protein